MIILEHIGISFLPSPEDSCFGPCRARPGETPALQRPRPVCCHCEPGSSKLMKSAPGGRRWNYDWRYRTGRPGQNGSRQPTLAVASLPEQTPIVCIVSCMDARQDILDQIKVTTPPTLAKVVKYSKICFGYNNKFDLINKICFWPWKVNFKIWPQVTPGQGHNDIDHLLYWYRITSSRCVLTRCIYWSTTTIYLLQTYWSSTDDEAQPHVSSSFYQMLFSKNVRWPDDVIMWPFNGEMMHQRAGISSMAYLVMILGKLSRMS